MEQLRKETTSTSQYQKDIDLNYYKTEHMIDYVGRAEGLSRDMYHYVHCTWVYLKVNGTEGEYRLERNFGESLVGL